MILENKDLVAARVRKLRRKQKYTIEQLSKAAMVSTSSIVDIENAKRYTSFFTLTKIAETLGVDPYELNEGMELNNDKTDIGFVNKYINLDKDDKARVRKIVSIMLNDNESVGA